MKVGSNIRKIRELKSFSQENMADELEISQKQYSRIENDHTSPTLELLERISKILKITIHQLLGFDEQMIFQNATYNQKGGEFKAYNATDIDKVTELYERLLKTQAQQIEDLQKKLKQ